MEKQEKYVHICIGCRICKRKFVHHLAKFKMEIGGKCTTLVRGMSAMGAPMLGKLKQGF